MSNAIDMQALRLAKREKFIQARYNEVIVEELEYILAFLEENDDVDPIEFIEHRLDSRQKELEELDR